MNPLKAIKQTKKATLLWFSLFIFNSVYSQHLARGIVIDSKGSPIPFVHITLENNAIGTVANQNGEFQLWIPQGVSDKLSISSIGYKTRTLSVTDDFQRIFLAEDVTELSEVAITPRDYAREIIEKAIANIPKNYPAQEERLRGFIRELGYWKKDGEQKPLYIAEAVIESIKKPYQKKSTKGTVTLIESRKHKSLGHDTLRYRFYAGPHHTHRFDVVSVRTAFLQNPDKYTFEIKDTLRFNHSNLFEISFRHKKGSPFGKVYITDSTFALAKTNITYTKFSPLNLEDINRKMKKYEAIYYQGDDKKWRLEQTDYFTIFDKYKDDVVLTSHYATTQVSPNTAPIPYVNQIQFYDIFLKKTGMYDSAFWKNYNIVLPDSSTEALFRTPTIPPENEVQTKRPKLIEVIKKIRFSNSIGYNHLTLYPYTISFSNTEFSINESKEESNHQFIDISTELLYEWKPSFFVGVRGVGTFDDSNLSIDLIFLKEFNIHPKGRPIFISPELFIGYQKTSKSLGNFKSQSTFRINGKEFDSGSTTIYLQQRGLRIAPSVSLGLELSHRIQLFLSGTYNFPIHQTIGLEFDEEDQFFLKQKKSFLTNGSEGLSIDNDAIFKNNFRISGGIYFSF